MEGIEDKSQFSPRIDPIRPELITLESMKDIYNKISTDSELNQEFEKGVKELWSKFIEDYDKSINENKPFDFTQWVIDYMQNIDEKVFEGMPFLEYLKPALKSFVLYYVLNNLQEIQPGVFISIPRPEDKEHIVNEENQGLLGDALNYVASMCELYYNYYRGEIYTVNEVRELQNKFIKAKDNNASSN